MLLNDKMKWSLRKKWKIQSSTFQLITKISFLFIFYKLNSNMFSYREKKEIKKDTLRKSEGVREKERK